MRREAAAARGHEADDRLGAVHRLERADAKHDVRGTAVERQQQIDERAARFEVPPEGAEVHAREDDLLEPGRGDPRDLADHVVNRHAAARAARGRDDAVGARLFASGLDAQRERRAPGDPGLDRGSARTVAVLRVRVARRGYPAEQILDQTCPSHRCARRGPRWAAPRRPRRSASRSSRSRPRGHGGCLVRCGGSSGGRPDRRRRSPSTC